MNSTYINLRYLRRWENYIHVKLCHLCRWETKYRDLRNLRKHTLLKLRNLTDSRNYKPCTMLWSAPQGFCFWKNDVPGVIGYAFGNFGQHLLICLSKSYAN